MRPGSRELDTERLRGLLCALGSHIQQRVVAARGAAGTDALAAVAAHTASDTLYHIDRIGERAVLDWLEARWPPGWPVQLVMEGIDAERAPRFPKGAAADRLRFVLIVDPIDGTRMLMHDKRSAWALMAVAPIEAPGAVPRIGDTVVAAMTELPPTKQRLADQLSAVRGAGRAGLRAERVDLDRGTRRAVDLRPSQACDLAHGFAAFARFFPEGKAFVARFEEALWRRLGLLDAGATAPLVFDDQYLCTGGQFYELLAGRDRMLGDLRPQVFAALGLGGAIACHPYDACTALLLEEAGCRISAPDGTPLDFPLDATSPVAWVAFANAALEARVRPALDAVLAEFFGGQR